MKKNLLFLAMLAFGIALNIGAQQSSRAWQYATENQPIPDLGNGFYHNPVLPGAYGDPSLVKVGTDYYMIHSGGNGHGFVIFNSRDLVNWAPLAEVPVGESGNPWAPDLVYVNGRFFIYVTQTTYLADGSRRFDNYVYHADKIVGPWQGPVNLNIKGLIDPGHLLGSDGKRYLYMEKGYAAELSADGLSLKGELKKVYDGWKYPNDWVVECPCLEGPKFMAKDGYYFLVSALGGTNGPSTSHMAAVARSKNPLGPWVESPYNPLIHTRVQSEKWWSQGHATLIEGPDGNWWAIYHAYQNGHKNLGRSTLLLPVEWTSDGWPRIKDGVDAADLIAKPVGGENVGHGMPLSDDFTSIRPGMQWDVSARLLSQIITGNGTMVLPASGSNLNSGNKITVTHTNASFEVSVKVSVTDGAEGGLMVGNCAVAIRKGLPPVVAEELDREKGFVFTPVLYNNGQLQSHRAGELKPLGNGTVWFKIRNYNNDITLYWSEDGMDWQKFSRSFMAAGGIKPGLFAAGNGSVAFSAFKYFGIVNE